MATDPEFGANHETRQRGKTGARLRLVASQNIEPDRDEREPRRDQQSFLAAISRWSGAIRIAFLYNHDALHQVAHTAPIIAQLGRIAPEVEVHVLTSDERQAEEVRRHLGPALRPPSFKTLTATALARVAQAAIGGLVPLSRIATLSANRALLAEYDAIVVPETTSTLLKTRYGVTEPGLIFLPHGAGDRSVTWSPEIALFDFVLLPGEKTKARMLADGLVRPDNHAVVGYPKFDGRDPRQPERFFNNDKPVVLYNPHFDPALSSWYDLGEQVLDFFAAQDRFNLIFAPHVMLFKRRVAASLEHRQIRVRRDVSARFRGLSHIRIDTGSRRSIDMSYTSAADIYLGDVSSQIYEFIAKPRPAVFLNPRGLEWWADPNFDFWHMGDVVRGMTELQSAMDRILPLRDSRRQTQAAAFRNTFSIDPDKPSARRAAEAILGYLATRGYRPANTPQSARGPSPPIAPATEASLRSRDASTRGR